MLTVLHVLGNEAHESIQRNILDESAFYMRHGVDIRFAYDPLSPLALETDYIEALHELGSLMYKFPYLNNASIRKTRHDDSNSSPEARLSPLQAALTLREMCISFPVDVIHTHTEPAFRLGCAARFLGAPVAHIYTAHAVTENITADYLFNRLLSVWCDELLAIDGYTAGILLDRLIRVTKIKRVNYGIDLSKWHKGAEVETGWAGNTDDISDPGSDVSAGPADDMKGPGTDAYAEPASDMKGSGADAYPAPTGDMSGVFKLLMIADSDPISDGTAYDVFADLVLRLLHDFNQGASEYKQLNFVIATNSEHGLYYARDLINTLDLNDNIEVTSLSNHNRYTGGEANSSAAGGNEADNSATDDSEAVGSSVDSRVAGSNAAVGGGTGISAAVGGGVDSDVADGSGEAVDSAAVDGEAIGGTAVGVADSGGDTESSKTAWSKVKVGNWVESEAKIKLRSYKYKSENKLGRFEGHHFGRVKKLFGKDNELSRQALYQQADLCLYYSENRFFPYPVIEAIALGIPVMTNDRSFYAELSSSVTVASNDDAGKVYAGVENMTHDGDYIDKEYSSPGTDAHQRGADSIYHRMNLIIRRDNAADSYTRRRGGNSARGAGHGVDGSVPVSAEQFGGDGVPLDSADQFGGDGVPLDSTERFGGGDGSAPYSKDDNGGGGDGGTDTLTNDSGSMETVASGSGRDGNGGDDSGGDGSGGDSNGIDGSGGDSNGGDGSGGDGGARSAGYGAIPQNVDESAFDLGYANFNDPGTLTDHILSLIYKSKLRADFAIIEEDAVRSRYDIENMIIGIYDSYVKGLRA